MHRALGSALHQSLLLEKVCVWGGSETLMSSSDKVTTCPTHTLPSHQSSHPLGLPSRLFPEGLVRGTTQGAGIDHFTVLLGTPPQVAHESLDLYPARPAPQALSLSAPVQLPEGRTCPGPPLSSEAPSVVATSSFSSSRASGASSCGCSMTDPHSAWRLQAGS